MPSLVSGGNPATPPCRTERCAASTGPQAHQASRLARLRSIWAVPKSKATDHQSEIRLGDVVASKDAHRRGRAALKKADTESGRANRAIRRELKSLRAKSRKELEKLLGPAAIRDLNAIRADRSKQKRSKRRKRALAVLSDAGVELAQVEGLRRPYLVAATDVLSGAADDHPTRAPADGPCASRWVTYRAPFSGYSWSFEWSRSANPADPALTRYLDLQTGRIGSRIETEVSSAGDDDDLVADYYTGLNVWHTPLGTGPLEVILGFAFSTSTYSGTVKDEWGISDVTYSQFARARLFAADSQDSIQRETQESRIYSFIDVQWGADDSWSNYVARPLDMHWYHFKTAAAFKQDSPVLLEGGINHMNWFETNDESVSMSADLDLRLDRIMVRSCEGELIL